MEALDVREFLDHKDLIKIQLLVSCKINRLEKELLYITDLPFINSNTYNLVRSDLNYYEQLYEDIESILLNY